MLRTLNNNQIKYYIFNRIGECYKKMGKLDEAIKMYQISLSNGENNEQLKMPENENVFSQ
ncbi:MAG: hypothetical protein AYP45_05215 [Candidatus Brocadia carolinensis]|uniref:Uncharacterized protein n=1 Tax=Candidatus Brocadia carolinensis TaxID=1004156 RepID=A0A1V4AVD0_9BACT|nr:MAG: hypothetical protein AYP45_05215 [Candidatus Brocadia caroliniensis]